MDGLKVSADGCTITRNGETTTIAGLQDLADWLTDHPTTPPGDIADICIAIDVYYTAPPPYIAVDWHAPGGPVGIIRRGQSYSVETLQ